MKQQIYHFSDNFMIFHLPEQNLFKVSFTENSLKTGINGNLKVPYLVNTADE